MTKREAIEYIETEYNKIWQEFPNRFDLRMAARDTVRKHLNEQGFSNDQVNHLINNVTEKAARELRTSVIYSKEESK